MKFEMRRLLAVLAATLVLCFSGCSSRAAESTESEAPSSSVSEAKDFPKPDVAERLAQAVAANPEVVGWLTVPGTTIDEPVVQGEDNTYYLRRDYKKGYAYSGSLFLDYRAFAEPPSQNCVIYGHNLGSPMGRKDNPDGDKFAQLLKFLDPEFAKSNPYLYFTTTKQTHIYQIFSVAYAEAYTRPVEYHHQEYTAANFKALTSDMAARSVHDYGVAVKADDVLLTLSTCTYKFGTYSQNPDQRYVVMGRLVKPGEAYAATAELKPNPTPKEPDFGKR